MRRTLHPADGNGPFAKAQLATQRGNEHSSTPPPTTSRVRSYGPLLELHQDEITRLCWVYQGEIGEAHPILDIQGIIAHARHITPLTAPAEMRSRLAGVAHDEKTLQLILILCCALLVENNDHSGLTKRLFESIEETVEHPTAHVVFGVVNLPFLCLLAGYHFLSNDTVMACRVSGQVVRLCVELRVHKIEGIAQIHDAATRQYTLNCFWSAFVMEQLWGFSTHLPCTMQDEQIDSELPIPVSEKKKKMLTTRGDISDSVQERASVCPGNDRVHSSWFQQSGSIFRQVWLGSRDPIGRHRLSRPRRSGMVPGC